MYEMHSACTLCRQESKHSWSGGYHVRLAQAKQMSRPTKNRLAPLYGMGCTNNMTELITTLLFVMITNTNRYLVVVVVLVGVVVVAILDMIIIVIPAVVCVIMILVVV